MAALEKENFSVAQEILAYIHSEPIYKEASHTGLLESNPEWGLILGLGYHSKSQKNSLIYKHLQKLVAELKSITKADPAKAKQLSELLYRRTHAGACHNLCDHLMPYRCIYTLTVPIDHRRDENER